MVSGKWEGKTKDKRLKAVESKKWKVGSRKWEEERLKEELDMVIKVLGSGCKNCKKLYSNVEEAAKNKGVSITLEKVTDYKDIVGYGVMKTPALVIDEEVKVSGRIAKVSEIEAML